MASKVLGVLLILIGIAAGLYVGVWVFFIGGIIGLITAAENIYNGLGTDAYLIGISIVKLMFAGFASYVSAVIFVIPAIKLLGKDLD